MAMKKDTKQILLIGGLGVGGYLLYSWWQGRQAAGAEQAAYYPYGAGAGAGGGFGSILWGGGVPDSGPCNQGTPEEEATFTETGEQVTATGETPMGSNYRILDSGQTEIFNPYLQVWEPIAYPGPAFVKEHGPAPYGELSAELVRQLHGMKPRTPPVSAVPVALTPAPSFEPTAPLSTRASVLTGRTPMGTAYRLASLERGAESHVYNPYTGRYGLGAWEKVAYPGPAVVKQPGLQPYGEPSAQAARAASAARTAAAAAKVAYPGPAVVKQPGPQPYGEPSAQAARAASAARTAAQRVTEAARVGAARAAAGQIAYPTFAPSTAAEALIARVPMAGGGHL